MLKSVADTEGVGQDTRRQELLTAQVRLLYANANLGTSVTILAATLLSYLQWSIVPRPVVVGWWLYMILVSAARYLRARRFHRISPPFREISEWRTTAAILAGLGGAGWGGAGILFYTEPDLASQVLVIFVLGGMMLGAASLLSPRPESYLAFLLPAGLGPTIRLGIEGDEAHLIMAALTGVFTVAVVIVTGRVHRALSEALQLRFENRDLVQSLRAAKEQTEALNEELEIRVQERTAELRAAAEQLRAEMEQRRQVEDELLRARKLESLGSMAGGIAHDFNNFLTVIQGNIELARMQLPAGSTVEKRLGQMTAACKRASTLASQLLTFAKGGEPVRRVVSIAKLVTDAVDLARAGAPVSIAVSVAEDLRPALVDPGQIGQVLHNILQNARQALPEGGLIEVRAQNVPGCPPAEPRIEISIRDHGCGISPEILPRIFDPYFSTRPGGTGFGLATAHAIVVKHGGRISVESAPGRGTLFTVNLPATLEAPEPEPADIPAPQSGTGRILAMDDEESLRTLIEAVLTQLGYEIRTARDGAEAIALYQEAKAAGQAYDAVLLDLTVSGGMGGVEAASKLKALDPSALLIVSSGYSDAPVLSNFARYGFDAVVPKPWTAPALSQVLRKLLGGRRTA